MATKILKIKIYDLHDISIGQSYSRHFRSKIPGTVETGIEQSLSLLGESSWEHDSKKHDMRQKDGSFPFLKKEGPCLSSAPANSMKEAGYELNSTNIH